MKCESYLMIFQNLANLHAASSWSLKPNDCFKVLTSLHPLKIFKVHQPNGHLIFIRMIGQCTKHVLMYLLILGVPEIPQHFWKLKGLNYFVKKSLLNYLSEGIFSYIAYWDMGMEIVDQWRQNFFNFIDLI